MSVATIAAVFGLALLDTLSPAVIGVTLYLLLAAPRRVGLLLGAYLGSVAVAYFALGVLLMLGLGAVVPLVDDTVWAWGQAALGVALIVGSYFIPAKKHPEKPEEAGGVPAHEAGAMPAEAAGTPTQRPVGEPAKEAEPWRGKGPAQKPRSFTVPAMLLLGLGTWLFEFSTAVPYFGAIGIMTAADLPATRWLLLLAGYVTIMVIPGVLLFLAWVALGERMRDRFERWRTKVSSGSRTALSWMLWIAGLLILLQAAETIVNAMFGQPPGSNAG